MTSLKLFGAALVVAALAAPVSAQQAISEPGAYSFYHPNADVLNAGAPTTSASGAMAQMGNDEFAHAQMSVRMHHPDRHMMRRY
jgi:hypothetical protein